MVSCGPISGNQNRARTTFSGGYCGAFATTQALSWKRRNVQRVERFMTNREMVKPPRLGRPKLPEPNLPKRLSVPSLRAILGPSPTRTRSFGRRNAVESEPTVNPGACYPRATSASAPSEAGLVRG
jgi:hypothetical protein